MTVTPVGTPAMARSATGSVTGTWGTGQNRTAGNLLVAIVSAIAQTTVTAPGAPGGWVKPISATAGSRCSLGVFTRVATSGDAAPAFSSTLSGTGAITVTLFELAGADPSLFLQAQGTTTGTTANPLTVTSTTAVAQAGSYAIAATGLELTSAAADAETPLAGWSAAADDAATSDVVHTAVITQAGPAVGSALPGSVTWGAAGNSCAAVLAVFQPPVQFQQQQAFPGQTWRRRFHYRQLPQQPALPPPFTVVQAAPTVQASSLTTATVTLPQPTGTGNTLVACVTTNGNTTNPAVSGLTLGGAADNWRAAFTDPAASPFGAAIWYDPACAGGQTAVVVNCTGGAGTSPTIYIAVYEVAGVLAFDQASHGDVGSGATTWSSGATPTTTQANEIFFGACMPTSGVIPTVTGVGAWTTQGLATVGFGQVSGYQQATATGSATFSGTVTSSGYSAVVATFSAGAGTVTGTAALALPHRGLSGTVTETETGSGGSALRKRGLAGTVTETETAAGGAAFPRRGLAGTATVAATVAAGGLARKHPGLAATATETQTSSGGLARRHATLAGTATETEKATGGVARRHPAFTAAATETSSASGGLAFPRRGLAGTGTVTAPGAPATGALALRHRGLAGTAAETETSAGSAAQRHRGLAGTATQTEKTSGGAAFRRRGLAGTATGGTPAAFTVGSLTASGTPASTLTAAGASSALSAATAAQGTLTAGTQSTGGPS